MSSPSRSFSHSRGLVSFLNWQNFSAEKTVLYIRIEKAKSFVFVFIYYLFYSKIFQYFPIIAKNTDVTDFSIILLLIIFLIGNRRSLRTFRRFCRFISLRFHRKICIFEHIFAQAKIGWQVAHDLAFNFGCRLCRFYIH